MSSSRDHLSKKNARSSSAQVDARKSNNENRRSSPSDSHNRRSTKPDWSGSSPDYKRREKGGDRAAVNTGGGSSTGGKQHRINFDFKLFVKQGHLSELGYSVLEKIQEQNGLSDMYLDERTEIPELPGQILVIQGDEIEGKTGAFKSCLRRISEKDLEQQQLKQSHSGRGSSSAVGSSGVTPSTLKQDTIVFVPEGLVSMVIGTKGRQINELKEESRAEIVVNQPIIGMKLRSVSIKGNLRQTTQAVNLLYECLERNAYTVEDFESATAKPMSKDSIKTTAKFVISENSMGFLIGKHGAFTKCLQENGIYMKCYKDRHNRALKSREAICSLYGTLSDIEHAIKELIDRLVSYYESSGGFDNESLALLVPYTYVTKIIGAGGCLIKELVTKTGAQIKVCSSKDSAYTSEIVITIDGDEGVKLRGARAILEKVELFRNGGPILHTGQAWSGNLLSQMRNSVGFESQRNKEDRGKRSSGYSSSHRSRADHHREDRDTHRKRSRSQQSSSNKNKNLNDERELSHSPVSSSQKRHETRNRREHHHHSRSSSQQKQNHKNRKDTKYRRRSRSRSTSQHRHERNRNRSEPDDNEEGRYDSQVSERSKDQAKKDQDQDRDKYEEAQSKKQKRNKQDSQEQQRHSDDQFNDNRVSQEDTKSNNNNLEEEGEESGAMGDNANGRGGEDGDAMMDSVCEDIKRDCEQPPSSLDFLQISIKVTPATTLDQLYKHVLKQQQQQQQPAKQHQPSSRNVTIGKHEDSIVLTSEGGGGGGADDLCKFKAQINSVFNKLEEIKK